MIPALPLILLAMSFDVPPPADDPPLWVLGQFPSAQDALDAIEFSDRYRQHVEARKSWYTHRRDDYDLVLQEIARRREAWQLLLTAREGVPDYEHEGHYPDDQATEAFRRATLAELRDRLGRQAFDLGEMPLPVPMAYFEAIDR